ncbi:AarF/ABC1/UbiB kinase family protein [Nocardia sp. NBC_01503]|uniref:ABC1 kinase family protein n=1 Tax=Nocardia sp. NBC_01503 TaxID=2975997 RepID=UPI002E7C2EC6|nr:AarF/ABC1/UbiB kinase family protein [Nocardia sp. NBC_01503]WTL29855.1 AarF/ABC1/UbiB kinase family protein [Nocardia sp. NBC_01503]
MTERRTSSRSRGTGGTPPVRTAVRNAKIASLPIAFAGRQAAGVAKRARGKSSAEVNQDIQLRTAQHIFEVLGELKGCAAKLGQLLALYELALPPELAEPYRRALAQLQDSTPTMLPGSVHAAMAAEMGASWRWHFREFDDRHAAGASIGQVHHAVWRDGRQVAVKVMYPGAHQAVLGDLEQLRRLSILATVFVPGADVPAVTEAICTSVAEELDYAAEAEHQRVFAAAFADDPDFVVPEVITQRGDVIVSEWLHGTPVTRIIESGAPQERSRVGMLILRFLLSSWARTGLLYCDPHPGNFRVLPDGRLGVVDFGACVAWPQDGFTELVIEVVETALNGTVADLDAALRRHGFVEPGRSYDVEAIAEGIAVVTEPLAQNGFRFTNDWLRRRVRYVMDPRLSNAHRQMTIPAYVTPFARALLTAMGVLCALDTDGPVRGEFARWFPQLAPAFERYDNHRSQPTDLGLVRRLRADPPTRRFSVVS